LRLLMYNKVKINKSLAILFRVSYSMLEILFESS